MSNTYFQFKQFRIEQDNCAMKVGTDGVLLGAWANPGDSQRILDIGTGTGLIAIMLAQRSSAIIDAIEIDHAAFEQAKENGRNSPWSKRLHFIQASFDNYRTGIHNTYDLIVSNPPYHKETLLSPHRGRQLARHSDNLEYSSIIKSGISLLSSTGRISLILPAAEEIKARETAMNESLHCTRITRVFPNRSKVASRSLIEFSSIKREIVENSLIIEDGGRHVNSDGYRELTQDFYLKF